MRSLVLFFLCVACTPLAAAQGNESFYMLHMQDYDYLPPELQVPAGVEVIAMNFGPSDQSIPRDQWGEFYHTVTSSTDRSLFDVQSIPPDGSPHPFRAPSEPGTYPYYCVYHGDAQGNGMAGTLVVSANAAAPSPMATPPGATPLMGTPVDRDTSLPPLFALAACLAAAALLRRR